MNIYNIGIGIAAARDNYMYYLKIRGKAFKRLINLHNEAKIEIWLLRSNRRKYENKSGNDEYFLKLNDQGPRPMQKPPRS